MEKESQVKEYIQTKEKKTLIGSIISLKEEFNSLIGKEEKETKKGLNLFERLRNDKNLLTYAELKSKEEEKLSAGEKIKLNLLELKLSITCPYFIDFKDFLEELKKGEYYVPQLGDTGDAGEKSGDGPKGTIGTQRESGIQSQPGTQKESGVKRDSRAESVEAIKVRTFCGLSVGCILSSPYQKNSQTGVTWCSKTARENGKRFGIILPSGNAYDAGERPGQDCLLTLPTDKVNKKPKKKWKAIETSNFISKSKGNYADIYVESGSDYGHRASAFKDDSGQWYVLDPYTRVNGRLNTKPKKLEDYVKYKKIIKAHFYESKGYVSDSQEVAKNPKVEKAVQRAINIAENNCHGYERGGKGKNGNYDCSGLVNAAFKQAGFNIQNKMGTQSMKEEYEALGFEWISPYNPNNLKRGDIVLKNKGADGERHTEIYTGNGKFVGARSNYDKKSGDGSGKEISETSANWLTNYGWNGVLRYKG